MQIYTKEEQKKWLKEKEIEEKEFQTKLEKYNKDLAEYELWEAKEKLKEANDHFENILKKYKEI